MNMKRLVEDVSAVEMSEATKYRGKYPKKISIVSGGYKHHAHPEHSENSH